MVKSSTHSGRTFEVWLYIEEAEMRVEELRENGKLDVSLFIGSTLVVEYTK